MAALRRRHFLFSVKEVNPLDPKKQFLEAANALGLDACGACSVVFEDTLEKNLSRTGPIPFQRRKSENACPRKNSSPEPGPSSSSFSPTKQKMKSEQTSPSTPGPGTTTASITGTWRKSRKK